MSDEFPIAVVFDWDNTLIDTFPLILAGNNLVRRTFNLPEWDEAECRRKSQLAAKEMFAEYYKERAAEAEKIFYDFIGENHLAQLKAMDAAADLITYLAKAGVKMGVLSNKRGGLLRREVAALSWDPHFGGVLGADDVGDVGKPDPRGLRQLLQSLGIKKDDYSKVWYVGDAENDLKTANNAGVIPVFIENGAAHDPAQIALQRPKYAFKSVRECLDYLKTLR